MFSEKGCFVYLRKELDILFEQAIKGSVFPGAVIGIGKGGKKERKSYFFYYGRRGFFPGDDSPVTQKTFFDLASLTKPLATSLAVLSLVKEKKIYLQEELPALLGVDVPKDKRKIKLYQLLNHCSGFPDHRPYFEKLALLPEGKRKKKLFSWLIEEPLVAEPGRVSIYSDLGFMILGEIIERKSGTDLDEYVAEKIYKPLGLEEGLFFRPLFGREYKDHEKFAATEKCAWRKKVICGEVHDDNCFVTGGVAGHAGLFGDIESVLALTVSLLDQWQNRTSHPSYENKELAEFLTRRNNIKGSTWALGFDTPAREKSSGGSLLSSQSAGHLGFSGTSFWIDREKDLVVVLLTNRVHPDRENFKIREFRPLFHDTVIRTLYEL